jgi:hypothetical protein
LRQYYGFIWLLLLLPALLIIQRKLHREIQAIILLLTRRMSVTIVLYSLLFFPGVVLHEFSHWLMAKLLWVPTGRFSLFPRQIEEGRIRLGFVETAKTDLLRDALIGAAPLFAGGIVIAFISWTFLGISQVWDNLAVVGWESWGEAIRIILRQPDFWLWFYLIFAISSTMFPSSSDWRAWPPLFVVLSVLLLLLVLAGAGQWLAEYLAPGLNALLEIVAMILGVSLGVHLVLFIPLYFGRLVVSRITGLKVV